VCTYSECVCESVRIGEKVGDWNGGVAPNTP